MSKFIFLVIVQFIFSQHNHALMMNTKNDAKMRLTYHLMTHEMEDLYRGAEIVSAHAISHDFLVIPVTMSMKIHQIELAYPLNNTFILNVNSGITNMRMSTTNHHVHPHLTHDHSITSLNDLKLNVSYRFSESENATLLLKAGISVPTGSISNTMPIDTNGITQIHDHDESIKSKSSTLRGINSISFKHDGEDHNSEDIAPYNMQTGSGTLDLVLGAHYKYSLSDLTFFSEANTVLRFYNNSQNYRLGNFYEVLAGLNYSVIESLTLSADLNYRIQNHVEGESKDLNEISNSDASTLNTGYKISSYRLGLNYNFTEDLLVNAAYQIPLKQDFTGYQLSVKREIMFAITYMF